MSCCSSTEKSLCILSKQVAANYRLLKAEIDELAESGGGGTPPGYDDLVSDVAILETGLDAETLARINADSSFESRISILESYPFQIVTTDAELRAALLIGGTILVQGDIVLTGRIDIIIPGTRLMGFGSGVSSITLPSGTGSTSVVLVNAVDVLVQDLSIVGNTTTVRPHGFSWVRSAHRTTIRNCHIRTVLRAIDLFGGGRAPSEDLVLKDLTIEQNTISDFAFFAIEITWDLRRVNILRNKIFGSPDLLMNGIYVGIGIEAVNVKDNYIQNVGRHGIEVFYPDAIWDKVTGGISPIQSAVPRVNDPGSISLTGAGVIVEGNVIYNAGRTGITVTGSPMGQVTNNQIHKFKFVGIEYVGEGNMVSPTPVPVNSIDSPAIVSGNSVREGVNPSDQPNGVVIGISVDQTQYALVTDNHVQDIVAANANCMGIYIQDGYNNTIQGNQVIKGGAYYIRANRSTGTIIRNNVLRATVGETPAPNIGSSPLTFLSEVWGIHLASGAYTVYDNHTFPNSTARLNYWLSGLNSSVVLEEDGPPCRTRQATDGDWGLAYFDTRGVSFKTKERRFLATGGYTEVFGIPGNLLFTFQATISGVSADGSKVSSFVRRGTILTRSRPPASWQLLNSYTVGTDYETDSTSFVTISVNSNVLNVTVNPPTGETWNWSIKVEGTSAQFDP
jgi:hypothetical protein